MIMNDNDCFLHLPLWGNDDDDVDDDDDDDDNHLPLWGRHSDWESELSTLGIRKAQSRQPWKQIIFLLSFSGGFP